jgi:hypothetical protein
MQAFGEDWCVTGYPVGKDTTAGITGSTANKEEI